MSNHSSKSTEENYLKVCVDLIQNNSGLLGKPSKKCANFMISGKLAFGISTTPYLWQIISWKFFDNNNKNNARVRCLDDYKTT